MSAITQENLSIGSRMPDGTIYAGISPSTGRPMYATPNNATLTCTFNEAGEYASKLDAHGHNDWRVPSKVELNVLFQNRAAIGGFDTSGSHPAGWYWSSSRYGIDYAWAQSFSDGGQYDCSKLNHSALRYVRG